MRRLARTTFILTGFLVTVMPAALRAEIPRMINYQAQLKDSLGVPITQNGLPLEFRLYDASVGGTAVWQEGPVGIDVLEGLLTHRLGSNEPLPDTLFTRFEELWLELVVDGEVTGPRAQLVASAYAFRVSTVDSASGGAISGAVSITGTAAGYQLEVFNSGGGGAGNFQVFDFATSTAALRAQSNGTGPAVLMLHDLEGEAAQAIGDIVVMDLALNEKLRLEPTTGLSGGGRVTMLSNDGDTTVTVEGDYFGRGHIVVRDSVGAPGVTVDGLQAKVTIVDPRPTAQGKIDLLGRDTFQDGSAIDMYNAAGQRTLLLDSDVSNNGAAKIELQEGVNDRIILEAFDGSLGGAKITLYDGSNNATVILDSDNAGDGRVTTEVLEITGGADLSEQFDIASADAAAIEPGTVLAIDPDQVGQLRISDRAYDPTVAGIVSGAGGVKTGMLMGQTGTAASGRHAVALTGRVWCKVDAAYGAVAPGDLLTSSETPGHAMKAADRTRMHGALIGKAMSSLTEGTGLVLVLVGLQ